MMPTSTGAQLLLLVAVWTVCLVLSEIALKAWRDEVKGLAYILWIGLVFFLWQMLKIANMLLT